MNVFPAIDIYDNKVVRLKNGDFDKIRELTSEAANIVREIRG